MTLVEKLDRLPPMFARLLAKNRGRLMTDTELAKRTGWGMRHLKRVYQAATWRDITAQEVDTFLSACGLSWSSQRRQRWLLQLAFERKGIEGIFSMYHLRPKNWWQAHQLNTHRRRLTKLLQEHEQDIGNS